jgi:molecular chaperone DnaK
MNKQILNKAIGIDLGTTNSAVAIMTLTDTDVIIHRDARTRRETTPSCVWKDPRTQQVLVGSRAFQRIGTTPEPIRSIKRSMGKQTTVSLTDVQVTPEEVSASILREMKLQIEDDVAQFTNETCEWAVTRAIVTVPAYFDQPQIEATRKAAEMAGLQVLELLHEPTAAASYYCWQNRVQNGTFLVYDFGGGTFDVSILRSVEGSCEVLGISGNNRLGGDDLDVLLAEELRQRLVGEGYELELNLQKSADRRRFEQLKMLAEGVKKALSTEEEFVLRSQSYVQDQSGTPINIDMLFERTEVEALYRPTIERTLP